MAKAKNKTQQTEINPLEFLGNVEPEQKRDDCLALLDMMHRLTGKPPRMWGPSIIGFGEYHYKYDSGREGDFFRVGFAPRAQNIVIYIMPGYQDFSAELSRLGKHKTGKSCLYIKRLSDIETGVLEEIIIRGLEIMAQKYPVAD